MQAARRPELYCLPAETRTIQGGQPCYSVLRAAPFSETTADMFLCDSRSDAPWTPDSAGSTGGTPPPMMPAAARGGARGPLAEFCVDLGDACPSLAVHGSRIVAQTDGAPAPTARVACKDLMQHRVDRRPANGVKR